MTKHEVLADSTRKVFRSAMVLSLSVASALGLSIAAAAPAQGASYIEGCFRTPAGIAGFPGARFSLQRYVQPGTWQAVYTNTLDKNSCGRVNIGPSLQGYYVRLWIKEQRGNAVFTGATNHAPPGAGRWNVGTGIVHCSGCIGYR